MFTLSNIARIRLRTIFSLLGIVAAAYFAHTHTPWIIQTVDDAGMFAPLLFIILHCLSSILCLPTILISLAGGALFGPTWGILFNVIGATCGALCGFCLSRYLLPESFFAHKNPRIQALLARIDHNGWKIVAILRFTPVPYNVVNYALGATSVKLKPYIITTMICLIPNKIAISYFGYQGIKLVT